MLDFNLYKTFFEMQQHIAFFLKSNPFVEAFFENHVGNFLILLIIFLILR